MRRELGLILPFIGGKRQLLPKILPTLPAHTTYVEAFGGGAAVFFAKPAAARSILNDIDPSIAGFYRRFSCSALEPCKRVQNVCAFAREARQRVRRGSPAVCDQIAARRFSIVSDIHGGMKTEECKTKPIVTRQLENRCAEFEARLKSAAITNLDFRKVVKKYDAPGTLIFMDPPYPGTTPPTRFTARGATPADVCAVARKAKGKVLITYNDIPAVRQACRGLYIRSVPSNHRSKHVTKGSSETRELLISNFPLPPRIG